MSLSAGVTRRNTLGMAAGGAAVLASGAALAAGAVPNGPLSNGPLSNGARAIALHRSLDHVGPVLSELAQGNPVLLQVKHRLPFGEPDVVAYTLDGETLGFVERKAVAALKRRLESGSAIEGQIASVDRGIDSQPRISIELIEPALS